MKTALAAVGIPFVAGEKKGGGKVARPSFFLYNKRKAKVEPVRSGKGKGRRRRESGYMEAVTLKAADGYKLSLSVFAAEHAKGYVQIVHGMEEHKERYDDFAQRLCEAGYTVVSSDMRGHGMNAPLLGHFNDKNGYRDLLSDQKLISKYIRERYKVEKVIIFAHSMGTIITRNLLQTESRGYEKAVLCGYPYDPGRAATGAAIFLCNVTAAVRGPRYYSKFIHSLGTGGFNKTIKNPKTDLDWLSYDEENIKKYKADKYCGHGFTVSANRDLFMLVRHMSQTGSYRSVNSELPIFMIRGEDDPATGFEKGAAQSIHVLRQAGFQKIRVKTYPRMRHEILNESGRDMVIADIVKFLG